MTRLDTRAAALLAAVAVWGWSGGAAAIETATLAKTGDVAPDADGATFTDFGDAAVNGAGEVAFRGVLGGGDGIWVGGPAGLALVAKSGDAAPGVSAATFGGFGDPNLNGAGEVAFRACFDNPSFCSDASIWVGGPAGLALVARSGDAAPGAPGTTFERFDTGVILNGAGEVAFLGFLGPVDQGIWVGGPAGLALAARKGDLAPGAGGPVFDRLNLPLLNGAGEVAFRGCLNVACSDQGIWAGNPAGLALVARSGDAAPGVAGTTFERFSDPALNGAGEVAFRGDLSDGGGGIWLGGPAGLALVVKEGDAAPGAGGRTFTGFGPTALNGAGEVVIVAGLSGDSGGIWVGGPASLAPVAKSGDIAPGTVGETFMDFESLALNGTGEVAFVGCLDDACSDRGIWAGKPGGLQLIAREGDDIEVAPGDLRPVASSGLAQAPRTGNEDGRRSGFSEGGQTAFRAEFADTSSGIFLNPPDAPSVHRMPGRAIDSAWDQVMLPRSFANPVIIAGPPGSANKQPGVVRLRAIDGANGRFEGRVQEWRYLDGPHPEERTDFLALEKGRHKQSDGSIWEAGTVKVKGNRNWKKKRFTKRFRRTPEVFVTVQSFKGRTPVAARVRNVSRKGFEVSIQEEEKDLAGRHPREVVGYLATHSRKGRGTIVGGVEGTDYRLKQTRVSQRFKKVLGERLKLEEEKSKDKERKHKKERVSAMTLGRGLFAQQASDRESDTTAIRRR